MEVQTVSARGEAIPNLFRQLDRDDLAKQVEALPGLHMRFIEFDIQMRPEGPVLLEGQPTF